MLNDTKRWGCMNLDAPTEPYDIIRLNLSYEQLTQAYAFGYVDLDEAQNDSPTIGEFLMWALEHGGKGFPGEFECYIVSPTRPDARISVEGVVLDAGAPKACKQWLQENHPDEWDGTRAWWD